MLHAVEEAEAAAAAAEVGERPIGRGLGTIVTGRLIVLQNHGHHLSQSVRNILINLS